MTPEEQDLDRRVRERRVRWRAESFDRVIEVSVMIAAERERSDPAHKARMARLDDSLRAAIKGAAEHLQFTPVTWGELDELRHLDELLGRVGKRDQT